jgi:hypothetical protein
LLIFSVFFADLFQIPKSSAKEQSVARIASLSARGRSDVAASSPQPLILDEVIDLDLSTKNLKLFLDFMQVTARYESLISAHGLNIGIGKPRILLPLIDKYDCEAMRSLLKAKLNAVAWQEPWEVLYIACEEGDLELGREAISNLYPHRLHTLSSPNRDITLWSNLSKLSGAWQLEFLRLFMPAIRKDGSALVGELNADVATWAKLFNPKKYEDDATGVRKRKRS